MKFTVIKTETIKTNHITEKYVYFKPEKKYICPACQKPKRKLVGEFIYYTETYNTGFVDKYDHKPYCETCFDSYELDRLLNIFYEYVENIIKNSGKKEN